MSGHFFHILLSLCCLAIAAENKDCKKVLGEHKLTECCPAKPTRVLCTSTSDSVDVTFHFDHINCPEGEYTIHVTWHEEGETKEYKLSATERRCLVSGIKPWTKGEASVVMAYSHPEFGFFLGPRETKECETEPSRPSPPRNLRAVSAAEGNITISWDPPEENNGPLDGYLVDTCKVSSCDHPDHGHCTGEKAENRSSTSRSVARLETMGYCLITLSAYNKDPDKRRELKSKTAQLCVKSPPKPPEPLFLSLECTSDPNTLKATWSLRASPWDNYKIKVKGPRVGLDEESQETEVDTGSQCTKGEDCSVKFTDVKGGREYGVEVWPHIEYVPPYESSRARKLCTVPASAPPRPEKGMEMRIDNPLHPTIRISRDAFSDVNGAIRSYMVLLAEDEKIGHCKNPVYWEEAHATGPVKCYIAADARFYQTDKQGKMEEDPNAPKGPYVEFILGIDNLCDGEICNGPLREGTKYGVIIRAKTDGGSTDTVPKYFVAGVLPETTSMTTTGPQAVTTTQEVEGNGSGDRMGSVLIIAVALFPSFFVVW